MTIFLLILIVPGLACLYAMILRPMLRKIPALAKFYAEADGFWAKVWAICGKSITVLWGYILGGIGSALALAEPLSTALGDPDLNGKITSALQNNPQYLGYFTIAVSVITIAARLRSVGKTS